MDLRFHSSIPLAGPSSKIFGKVTFRIILPPFRQIRRNQLESTFYHFKIKIFFNQDRSHFSHLTPFRTSSWSILSWKVMTLPYTLVRKFLSNKSWWPVFFKSHCCNNDAWGGIAQWIKLSPVTQAAGVRTRARPKRIFSVRKKIKYVLLSPWLPHHVLSLSLSLSLS